MSDGVLPGGEFVLVVWEPVGEEKIEYGSI